MPRLVDIAIALGALSLPLLLAASLGPLEPDLAVYGLLGLGTLALGSELWAREAARRLSGVAPLPALTTWGWVVGVQLALLQHLVWPSPDNLERAIGGLALLTLGVFTRWMAVGGLGARFLLPAPPDAPLVTTGIYSQMRHPAATAAVMIAAGAALLAGSLGGVAWTVLGMVPLAIVEARREDRVLKQLHGEDHAAYCEKTPSLVPRPRDL